MSESSLLEWRATCHYTTYASTVCGLGEWNYLVVIKPKSFVLFLREREGGIERVSLQIFETKISLSILILSLLLHQYFQEI